MYLFWLKMPQILKNLEKSLENLELCVLIPIAMIASFILILMIIRVIIMFCCTRAQRKKTACKIGSLRKQDSGPMFARLEEFDVLTPLQPTPTSSIAAYNNYGTTSPSTSTSSDSRIQLIPPLLTSSSSDSPPPPRRPNHGKTLIVPLNASRYRTPMQMIALTPDSRLTSFEGGTTKSCATIPEDDEDEQTDDLLSIDRTSLSAYEPSSRYHYSGYNLCLPQPMPEFQSTSSGFSPMLPAPTYSPPSLPSESVSRPTKLTRDELEQEPEQEQEQDQPSVYEGISNSPHSSASISDSYYFNNFDVLSSAANSQIFEAESDEIVSKFQLHRIEEESEGCEEMSIGRADGVGSGGGGDSSMFFPRSISQQFDMMRQQSS